jgi:hypothetical protein
MTTFAEKNKEVPAPSSGVATGNSAADLTSLESEAAALDGAGASFAPAESGKDSATAAPQVSSAEIMRPLLRATFDILAPNWKIDDQESAALAEAYAAVLDKYFPDGFPWGVEVNALLLTVAIIGPRFKTPPRNAPENKPEAEPPRSSVQLAPAIQ